MEGSIRVGLTDTRKLRDFGLLMAIVTGAISAYSLYRSTASWKYLIPICSLFLLWSLIAPKTLDPIYRAWMKFGHILGIINTRILLTILFFVMVLPAGLIRRCVGKDTMGKKWKPQARTYRENYEQWDPLSRIERPY